MSCDCNNTPCTTCTENQACCETLPSALDNFILHFFGNIAKTESGGQVSWVLPCDLATGLAENPRGEGEGLACYFLRLFNEGLQTNVGPQGATGDPGADGANAYAISTSAITVPGSVGQTVQFTVLPTSVLSVGQTIFVPGAGWFQITAISTNTVFASLVELIPSPVTTVATGSPIIPTGPRGLTVVGPQGVQGDPGDPGDDGVQGVTGAVGPRGPVGPRGETATNHNWKWPYTSNDASVIYHATDFSELSFSGTKLETPIIGANGGTTLTDGTYYVFLQGSVTQTVGTGTGQFQLQFFDLGYTYNELTSTFTLASTTALTSTLIRPESVATGDYIHFSVGHIFTISDNHRISVRAQGLTSGHTINMVGVTTGLHIIQLE